MSSKPGWIRVSIHPTMTNQEIEFIMDAIESTASSFREWMTDYYYDTSSNEYAIKNGTAKEQHLVKDWFNFGYQVATRKVERDFLVRSVG
jgi:hypothetical protein